ncbi:hypothetical protein ONE62_38465 (plasmid) [Rhodococcus opacus]|nr:hypothetical protein [Rhodococcus opacus]UZG59657.1 hypothetical protein ONE62_38465 [Rhodococcus opacus]
MVTSSATVAAPVFQVPLSLNNVTAATLGSDGLEFEIAPQPLDIAKCDLHFHFTDHHNADGDPARYRL